MCLKVEATMNSKRVIFHIDVNSAFLSWTAVNMLEKGAVEDIRDITSVIGGDEQSRRGIVLAKSSKAKKYGIVTGESLYSARKKCIDLKVFSGSFDIYNKYSSNMMELIKEYTPFVEQYSIDECFIDVTNDLLGEPLDMANLIKERIKHELGFTVNVGISTNKVLAKMASELKKPNRVNTLYPEEIQSKMWPLPVSELFMVGKSASEKLHKMYINTIGDLANYSASVLLSKFKSYGKIIYEYANGIDNSVVSQGDNPQVKVISNATTLSKDLINTDKAHIIILELVENVSTRLRKAHKCCRSVSVNIRDSKFNNYSHQKQLKNPTDSTQMISKVAKELFDETWRKEPIRLIGVQVTKLCDEAYEQISLFDESSLKNRELDRVIDSIREKYGDKSIGRFIFMKKNGDKRKC